LLKVARRKWEMKMVKLELVLGCLTFPKMTTAVVSFKQYLSRVRDLGCVRNPTSIRDKSNL